MKKKYLLPWARVVVFCLSTLISHAAYAGSCDDFANGPAIQKSISQLRTAASINPPLWHDYKPDTHSYLFLSSKFARRCAVVYTNGAIVKVVELQAQVPVENGLFTWYVKSNGTVLNAEVDALLTNAQIGRALAFIVDFDFRQMGFMDYQMSSLGLDNLTFSTLVHEGFHLHGKIAGVNWPAWPSTLNRDKIDPKCYRPTKTVEQAYLAEATALVSAAHLVARGEHALARGAALDFLAKRAARRNLLASIVDEQGQNNLAFCEENEAAMEMMEGVAEWFGLGVDMIAGPLRIDQLVLYLQSSTSYDAFYYQFGVLQIYLMWKLYPQQFLEQTRSLRSSPRWQENIEAKLALLLSVSG